MDINDFKTEPTKKRHGGYRPGSGRPKRMDEQQVIEKLHPMADQAFRTLEAKLREGDLNALKLFMQYYLGLPTQKVESKIEGQLNQVNVEVVRPQTELLKKVG